MKKFLSMTLLFTAMFLTLSSCSKDDDGDDSVDYPSIIGSWSNITETPGDYVTSYLEVTWTFNANNTATQRVILKFNNVTSRDNSSNFTYTYKGNTITLKNDKTTLEYEISVSGNTMRLGNTEDGYFSLTKK